MFSPQMDWSHAAKAILLLLKYIVMVTSTNVVKILIFSVLYYPIYDYFIIVCL